MRAGRKRGNEFTTPTPSSTSPGRHRMTKYGLIKAFKRSTEIFKAFFVGKGHSRSGMV
jgi:hypothetical protein